MSTSIAQRAREAAQTTGKVVAFSDVQRQLVRGGYLRATLVGALTEFDIIAGGLAWGIRNSRYTLDVEFVENASIRDKLRVSENICTALKDTMKCPHQLLPHQIQGLDYPCIAIVVSWLLQRVAMAREDNAVAVSKYTSWDFARRFRMPLPAAAVASASADGGLGHFAQTHQLWRNSLVRPELARFRRPQRTMIGGKAAAYASPLEHANAILLEYGDQYLLSSHQQQQQQQAKQETAGGGGQLSAAEMDAAEKAELKQQKEEEEREKVMLERLLSSMSQHTEKTNVSSNELGAVLAAVNTKKLAKLQRAFDDRMQQLQAQLEEEQAERGRVEAKRQELADRRAEHAAMEAKAQRTAERLARARGMVGDANEERERKAAELEQQRADCDAAEARLREDAALAELLDRAFDTLARIKKTEERTAAATEDGAKRVGEAKEELAAVSAEMEALAEDNGGAEAAAAEDEAANPVARALAKSREKLAALEAELSRLDMDIMRRQRDIDSTLTRAEYAQYEQRLIELDEECACKYDETQLLIQEQNFMVEIARAITNEDDVMTNIFDGVKAHLAVMASGTSATSSKAKASKESLQAVAVQVQDFLKDIGLLREHQEAKLKAERVSLSAKRADYDAALSKQHAFRATVDEVARQNERLSAMRRNLRELRSALEGLRDGEADEI